MKIVVPKKRGRPVTGVDPVTAIRLSTELKNAIDQWASSMETLPSRSEAIRQILTDYLKRRGFLK